MAILHQHQDNSCDKSVPELWIFVIESLLEVKCFEFILCK